MAKIVGNSNPLNQPKTKAFTLAEVLITLVIIGIIAALTIPSVVVSYQKHETITRLKKAYSTLAQTTNKAIADHGPIKNWDFNYETKNGETKAFVDKYVLPYLKVAKNCGYDNTGECNLRRAYLNLPHSDFGYGTSIYRIELSDGSAMVFKNGMDTSGGYTRLYTSIYIDINGKRGPNVYGKDIFYYTYWISNDNRANNGGDLSGTFMPNGGYTRNGGLNKCTKQTDGSTCAALIMADNWQIKKDYPW